MKKFMVALLLVSAFVLSLCGCVNNSFGENLAVKTAEPTAEQQVTPVAETTQTSEEEDTATTPKDETASEGYSEFYCARFADDYGADSFAVELREAIFVNCDNEELIREYGLEEAYFDNDYEIVFPNEEWIRVCAFKDENSRFYVIDWDAEMPALSEKEVLADEFIVLLKEREEMFVEIELYKGYIVSLKETYLP